MQVPLHKLIELPLISAAIRIFSGGEHFASIFNKLLTVYEEHKKAKEYLAAVHQSEEHQKGEQRLSRKLWWAQHNYSQIEKLSVAIKDGVVFFNELNEKQQQMLQDFNTGGLKRELDEAFEQKASKRPCYRGAAAETLMPD